MNTNIISAILVFFTTCMVQSQLLRAGLFGNRGLLGSRANILVCIFMVIMAAHCRAHFSKVALVLHMILGHNLFTVLRHHTRFKGEIYQKSNFCIGLITVTSLDKVYQESLTLPSATVTQNLASFLILESLTFKQQRVGSK